MVRDGPCSDHHSCASTSTIAMPRPASADEEAGSACGRVPLPPSVTETWRPRDSSAHETWI